ncbi:carboxymuconolactone decarboxylase family protein [Paractinoplanes brasiliensis]|uniref:AhpD family alkylhydroperoxidase n=1 Tax=Paractinoplanes brasiliensis TaxID=52695 RepID=A0A4R6JX97_9ACTN|nr:carboxymuconolactone decarboxylase family protein [Actinoplanes brasiliensis]TDO39846.1 AhpD family alkylhydroperoxidase [Actinoplanes brasiliensis]GID31464.1 alkyl hydroperoxide reductase AhpD [Actinoplanes brasiliensis]
MFVQHTIESAPAASRPLMESTVRHLGHLPDAVSRLAESPEMLRGFLQASALFEGSTLDPLAREVVVMVIAARHRCRVCLAMHTGRLRELKADAALITALRTGAPPTDPRLAALRDFTLRVLATSGEVPDHEMAEFVAAGFTRRNALEVVLGIGTYTMSTLANRMVGA